MIDYKEILKDHNSNAFMLETYERPITNQSMICLSPYNTETGQWLCGMNLIIPMSMILDERLPIVTQKEDTELIDFLDINYPKGV